MVFAQGRRLGEPEGNEARLLGLVIAELQAAPALAGETDEAAAGREEEGHFFRGERGVGCAGDEPDIEPVAGPAVGFDFQGEIREVRRAYEARELVRGFDHRVGRQGGDPVGKFVGEIRRDRPLPAGLGLVRRHPLQTEAQERADRGLGAGAVVDHQVRGV